MTTALYIPKHFLDTMLAQARQAAPAEARGILTGRAARVESLYPMKPGEESAVTRKLRGAGQQMLAVYHSYPATPARPLAEDIRMALTPEVINVIVSLASEEPVVMGFQIDGDRVNEVLLQTGPAPEQATLQVPDSVRRDTLAFRPRVEAFLRGEISPVAFRAYRVPMGIYEQRTSGRYMVRVRIAAGFAPAEHFRAVAGLSRRYGDGVLHVTTRQDIQIHGVAIEDTPAVLEGLLEAGLSSRGGGGNTVRNISASPSGQCPGELFDTTPYAVALAEYLLQHGNSFNLPRKFKIAFSGCDDDCGQASIADLGFFARIQDGRRGFSVFAGGGMGTGPRPAIPIEAFVLPEEIFEIAEAVKRLFDRHGDRTNKHKARLRFVLARVGPEAFVRLYQDERTTLRETGLPGIVPEIRDSLHLPGSISVPVRLPLGNVSADALDRLADLADREGVGVVQTTQSQDLLLPGIPAANGAAVIRAVSELDMGTAEDQTPKIITCTGADTCRLGLCLSKNLATAIAKAFAERGLPFDDISQGIRISGCTNSCGGHQIGGIGLEGGTRRVHDRLMPFYSVYIGGRLSRDGAVLAEKIARVPAKRVPDLLANAFANGRIDPERVRALAPAYESLPAEIPEDYFFDYGAGEPFSLAGRGPGECGSGVMDIIRVDISEAKGALKAAGTEGDSALYHALTAAARSLLVIFGVEAKKDREIFEAFGQHLIASGWVTESARELIDAALDWRLGNRESLAGYAEAVRELVERVEVLFLSLDSDLKFRAEPLVAREQKLDTTPGARRVDLPGAACHINFAKAKAALEQVPVGDVLEIVLDDGASISNVSASLAEQGQEIVGIEAVQDTGGDVRHHLRIRRKK